MSKIRDYHNYNRYGGNLAQKKRRRFYIWISISLLSIVILMLSIGYLLFFSPYLQVKNISLNGLNNLGPEEINKLIEEYINEKFKNIESLKPKKNILFFNTASIIENLLNKFPSIKSIRIEKDYPDKIIINFYERKPLGSWCYSEVCYNFDEEGILWGKTIKSTGSLLLIIDDQRISDRDKEYVDPNFLNHIRILVNSFSDLNLNIKTIEIPKDSIGDYNVHVTDGYYLIFNTDSDLKNQLNTLRVFLDNVGDDFKPRYIDVRIEGRIYYQ